MDFRDLDDKPNISYDRTFKFSASHFNSRKTYSIYWDLTEGRDVTKQELLDAFKDIHGHNFIVKVAAIGPQDEEGFVINDEHLEKFIKAWDGINLSCLPEFVNTRTRSTTENLAMSLHKHLSEMYPKHFFMVTVVETEDVQAVVS